MSDILAREFVALGHDVRVITQTEGEGDFPFLVIRRPGLAELISQVKWCNVFLQNNISLRTVWPLLLFRRPLFITHQTWIGDETGSPAWSQRLKLAVLRHATNFSISRAIADKVPVPSVKVGNPFNDEVFRSAENDKRTHDLIFVGRLVSDKGVDVLIDALAILLQSGMHPRLTVVGDGVERTALEQKAEHLGLGSSISFVGSQTGTQLSKTMNAHRILVVPSRWPEPFGIVALEGLACGCVVVGSEQGGLPEAMGPCGLTFPNGDARALARVLQDLLHNPGRVARLREGAQEHLAPFSRRQVANSYLQAMGATS